MNRGDFKFEEVGASAGIGGGGPLVWGIGAAAIDIDNDGDLDIYVCNYNYPNQLFINQSIVDGKRQEGPRGSSKKPRNSDSPSWTPRSCRRSLTMTVMATWTATF
ncbi:MAG: VCBS repeat-containing protein [Verrucomicrobiales bacterium]